MTVYIAATALSIFFSWCWHEFSRKEAGLATVPPSRYIRSRTSPRLSISRRLCAIASALPLLLVAGFRYGVGTDYFGTYGYHFVAVATTGTAYTHEMGYYALELFVGFFTDNFVWLFVTSAAIFCFCYYKGIYAFSPIPAYSILLLLITNVYFIYLNGMRHGLACAICFLAYKYLRDGNPVKYMLTVLLAASFHTLALVMLPVWFLRRLELPPRRALVTLGIGAVGGSVLSMVLVRLISLTKYAYYFTSVWADDGFEFYLLLINMAIFVVYIIYYKKGMASSYVASFKICYLMQLLALIPIFLSTQIPVIKRVTWLFSIFQLIGLPLIHKIEEDKVSRFVITACVIFFFSLSIYFGIVRGGAHGVLPYRSVWDAGHSLAL